MFTQRHLSVIRAALRFWSEEMGPHGHDQIGQYCELTETGDDFPDAQDVEWIVENAGRLELRFAIVSADSANVVHGRLLDSAVAAVQAKGTRNARVAAILLIAD
jgi:hypothetical protein